MWCQLTKRLLWRPFRWRTSSSPEESQNVLGGRAKLSPGMVEVIEAPLLPSSFFSGLLLRERPSVVYYDDGTFGLFFYTTDHQLWPCVHLLDFQHNRFTNANLLLFCNPWGMVERARRRTSPGSLDKFFVTARDDIPYFDFLCSFTCEFRSFNVPT